MRLYILLAVVAMAVGCGKSDIPTPGVGEGDAILFGESPDNWGDTRGVMLGESNFTEMEVYGYFTGEQSWAGAAKGDIVTFMEKQVVSKQVSGEWSYSPTRFWSNNPANQISFFALAPLDEVETIIDEQSGKPAFKYSASQFTGENHDLVIDAAYDKSKGVKSVDFEMNHALTKVTLKANLKGTGDGAAFADETFHIQDVTLSNLYSNADLTIGDDRSLAWDVDKSQTTPETVASHGYTLASVHDESTDTGMSEANMLTTDLKSVMADGQAIFVLPQELGEVNRGEEAPMITISILRTYYASPEDVTAHKLTQVVYETKPVAIPQPEEGTEVKDGWEMGMHNELTFTFDLDKLKEFDTPMTLTSVVRPWTEVDVDVNIHPNTYFYANTNSFELGADENTADLYLYTNYDYDLRVPRSKYELDGSRSTARGFTFYLNGSDVATAPRILDRDGKAIEFETKPNGVYANGEKLKYYNYSPNPDIFLDKFFVLDDYYADDVPGPKIYHKDGKSEIDIKWLRCRIKTDAYTFVYYIGLTTRYQLGLYTNTSAESGSAGINKKNSDAVYIMRIKVIDKMLVNNHFYGAFGAEMLTNGGGMITYKSAVSIRKE